jgi:quercetin dioxygenase-like cupin family protein
VDAPRPRPWRYFASFMIALLSRSHMHDDDQSHWVVRGPIALTVGGDEYLLRAGDRDWLPAGTMHSARVVGDVAVTYLVGSKPSV